MDSRTLPCCRWNSLNHDSFQLELARWGPAAERVSPPTLAAARQYCRRLTRSHYENFTVASCLLPRRLRAHFYAVYAYCRWADDLSDETRDPQEALRLLAWWEESLRVCYQGSRPQQHPVFIALRPTIDRFRIPIEPFAGLLVAFRQDQIQSRYETWQQLQDYCRYSANPVGHLVLYLAEGFDAERAQLADAICTGLQLANFWQDVKRDWQRGRVYIPAELSRAHGISEEELAATSASAAFKSMLREAVDRAEAELRSGEPLIAMMPRDLRIDIALFLQGGLAILQAIRECDYDVLARRPIVTSRTKMSLLIGCWWQTTFH